MNEVKKLFIVDAKTNVYLYIVFVRVNDIYMHGVLIKGNLIKTVKLLILVVVINSIMGFE